MDSKQQRAYDLDDPDDEDLPEWAIEGETPPNVAENKPEWMASDPSIDSPEDTNASFLMMRMCSHFLSVVQNRMETYVSGCLVDFHNDKECNTSPSSEFTFRQHSMYDEYCSIFEDGMAQYIEETGRCETIEAIKRANEAAAMGKESMGTIVIDLLSAVSSFECFVEMMEEEYSAMHNSDLHQRGEIVGSSKRETQPLESSMPGKSSK